MTTMTTPRCDLPCCTETWAPFETLLCAVQVFCPHNHGDVLATVFRVEDATTSGPSLVTYVGTERERATTLTHYGVTAHVTTEHGHRWATREEIEEGVAHGILRADDEPHQKFVAACPRPTCTYELPITRTFSGKRRRTWHRIEALLNHYAEAQPGLTIRATNLDVDDDTRVSTIVLNCYSRVH